MIISVKYFFRFQMEILEIAQELNKTRENDRLHIMLIIGW